MGRLDYADLSWMMAAKVQPPQPLLALVERPSVRAALDPALRVRLSVIVAPAGFGKTTVLAQWRAALSAAGLVAGWVSLDEDDGEPLQFLTSAILALAAAGAELGVVEKMASQGLAEVPLTGALSAFLNAVARCARPLVLILDDFHRAQSAAADAVLEAILARCPDNLHLVLSSRERPRLALSALKAQGLLHELGPETLRFSVEDATPLFAGHLNDAGISDLVGRTEGWGVALQLARLWIEGASGGGDLLTGFSGRTADVADYFAEQVFNDLPPEARSVLLQLSVSERINGDLANAITGRSDCWEILARLERLHVLLIPLDRERRWFRCHLLFRDFLADLLERQNKESVPELHLAASRWFEAEGSLTEAVRHARLAEDYDRVTALIAAAGGWEMVLTGAVAVLRNLLRPIPHEVCLRYATLRIARSYLHIKDGEIAEARAVFDTMDSVRALPLAPGESAARVGRDILLIGDLIDGYEDHWVSMDDYARLASYVDLFGPGDHFGLGCLYETMATAALRLGDGPAVIAAAEKAVHHMRAANSILGLNYAYFHLGMSQIFSGRLSEAEAVLRGALQIAEENFGSESGQKAISDVLLAGVLYARNDVTAARRHMAVSMPQVEENDSWFDVLACGYQTAAALAFTCDGLGAALEVLARGEQTARRRNLVWLRPFLQAIRVRLYLRAGDVLRAAAAARSLDFTFTDGEWRTKRHVWRTHHLSGLALASLYIAQGAPGHAHQVLGDLRALAEAGSRDFHLIEIGLVEALALRVGGRTGEAVERLLSVLRLEQSAGASRLFLDEGAAAEALLTQALRQVDGDGIDRVTREQIAALLDALRLESAAASTSFAGQTFSERELQVLAELGHGYSNKEIARTLQMTENTVKFHLKNIFAKLGVDKRGLAVAKAREMAIIP